MATTQHSPFDFRIILPLSGGIAVPSWRTETAVPRETRDSEQQEDRRRLEDAVRAVSRWALVEGKESRNSLESRRKAFSERIHQISREIQDRSIVGVVAQGDAKTILDNLSTLKLALLESKAGIETAHELPHVETPEGRSAVPRSFALAENYLEFSKYGLDEERLTEFMIAVQKEIPLKMCEVWNLKPFLEFVFLEEITREVSAAAPGDNSLEGAAGPGTETKPSRLAQLVEGLRRICELDWKNFFVSVCEVEKTLGRDPQHAYERMDWESRETYRAVVADFAAHSEAGEQEIASKAVALAEKAKRAPASREGERRAHVGFYLVGAGQAELKKKIGHRSSLGQGLRQFILRWSDYFYLIGIEVIALALMVLLIALLNVRTFGLLAVVLLVLPAVGCAVTTMNVLATRIFPPRRLPKLDFSKGIPDDCATIVAVPALLTSEEQVRRAVQALETRFLANRDANLHFALLTDPADATQQFDEKDALAHLCSELIEKLNAKYAAEKKGGLFHFHRHRAYNAAEGLWMGWERKRGKLLEFNRYLLGQGDSFPVKAGDLSLLSRKIRYVITLDLDTQLPPGAAHRLVGASAHPLNRAVVDPVSNTVVEGYGILQPRVDISVKSASRSRFASLLSGDTGFDIYTRAVSDVYQDLFGEAIFTGKGIYEVSTFQRVLEQRFPCNTVLSHDLIEGVYARTGLVSDIEVVDDYPSHFSAFSRRKHRWVRGDWQIIFGLLPRVRNFSGEVVRNPLSHISRWKIIDNLRRSLMDCASFLILVYGWLCRPTDAAYWTLAALAMVLFPTYFQCALSVLTGGKAWLSAEFWKNVFLDFAAAHTRIFFKLTFLLHQSLVDADAVIRTLVRMVLTHKRLLEWETAADAELDLQKKSVVDAYLHWGLPISLGIGGLIFAIHPHTLLIASPFLIMWACAGGTCKWLDQPQRSLASRMSSKDRGELRGAGLRTWRFFREFSNERENWLVPDIVQETPPLVAHRVSPTNLGLLLNARQAALDLGWLTLPEFIADTEKTFEAVSRMPKCKGHLYNWYENETLKPVEPLFVSSVDNGNLLCSLWTMGQGCLEAAKQPLFPAALWQGIQDQANLLAQLAAGSGNSEVIAAGEKLAGEAAELSFENPSWSVRLRAFEGDVADFQARLEEKEGMQEAEWWARELRSRVVNALKVLDSLAPWAAGDSGLPELADAHFAGALTLESLPRVYTAICDKLAAQAGSGEEADERRGAKDLLAAELKSAIGVAEQLAGRLNALATAAQSMADQMDFGCLYDSRKKVLSIGYDGATEQISIYHYDLLASEARAAVFGAIAKCEIPHESWFELKRSFRSYKGEDVLLSWTGTAFEYLMPSLWIRAYPNTLLDRSARAAIRAQQKFAQGKKIPWGISESSCNQRNPDGHYRYHAFGVPGLAVHRDDCSGDLVVAPYATFLALLFDTSAAMKNIRKMKKLGWMSAYGFYEAADYTPGRTGNGGDHEIVRNWMAHHQAMSLVAIGNALCDSAMQRRFHAEPRVAAAERLLQERYPRVLPRLEDTAEIPEPDLTQARHAHRTPLSPEFRSLAPKLS